MADKGLSRYEHLNRGLTDNSAEIKRIYQNWAHSYDSDNDDMLGTVSQPTMVHFLTQFAPDKTVRLLDVGCGTGLVGMHLQQVGYSSFDGTDLSEAMLAHAKERGYGRLFAANITNRLPVDDNSYDACLCVGVFTHGHVGPQGFDELTRITKTGGLIGFTINEDVYYDYGFDSAITERVNGGQWALKLHEVSDYMTKKDVKGIYVIVRVTDKSLS